MAVHVGKNEGESSERLIQRFNKRIQQIRLVQFIRDRKFFHRKPTRRKIRQAALMRDHYRQMREKMKYYG